MQAAEGRALASAVSVDGTETRESHSDSLRRGCLMPVVCGYFPQVGFDLDGMQQNGLRGGLESHQGCCSWMVGGETTGFPEPLSQTWLPLQLVSPTGLMPGPGTGCFVAAGSGWTCSSSVGPRCHRNWTSVHPPPCLRSTPFLLTAHPLLSCRLLTTALMEGGEIPVGAEGGGMDIWNLRSGKPLAGRVSRFYLWLPALSLIWLLQNELRWEDSIWRTRPNTGRRRRLRSSLGEGRGAF